MLRLYVDDSGKEDHSPVQVLAGYLSTVDRWAEFNNEWQSMLDGAGIDAFRMSEAWRLARKYQRVGHLRRDSIIVQAIECIKRHAQVAFAVSMRFDDFHDYLDVRQDHSHFLGRVYNSLFFSLLSKAYDYVHKYQFDNRLEVVFDEQGGEPVKKILKGMDAFRLAVAGRFGDLVIPDPIFQNDKDTLPLQAADLLAWLLNRDAVNAKKQVDRSKILENILLGEALSMQTQILIWDRKRFEFAFNHLVRELKIGDDFPSEREYSQAPR